MARRKKNKKSKKWLYWVLFLVLFVVAGVVVYFVWDGYFKDDKKEDESSEIVEEKVEEDEGGKGSVEEDIVVEKEQITQYEGDNPNEANELTGVITYAAVNGDNLIIRVNIDQYLDGGKCELNLIQNGVKYSDSSNIVSITTATCEGFNVPVSKIGSGSYQIVIKINSGDKTGTINGEVNI